MLSQLVAEVMNDKEPIPGIHPKPIPCPNGEITGHYHFLAKLIRRIKPKRVVEFGTGAGFSAAFMMLTLPPNSFLTTVNHPYPQSGDDVGSELAPWRNDPRLARFLGDSREQSTYQMWNPNSIDLLFIDSDHTYACVSEEWRLYEPALADRAIVCLDDIRMNDMERFWDELPYEKMAMDFGPFGFGVVQYERGK